MNNILSKYNLTIVTRTTINSRKDISLIFINPDDKTYTPLKFYLLGITYADFIDEVMVEINKALNKEVFNDGIESGSEIVTLTPDEVKIEDQGYVNVIPTTEFKAILNEYSVFLQYKLF